MPRAACVFLTWQADTETSLELIEEMLELIPQDQITFDVLAAGVGDVRCCYIKGSLTFAASFHFINHLALLYFLALVVAPACFRR